MKVFFVILRGLRGEDLSLRLFLLHELQHRRWTAGEGRAGDGRQSSAAGVDGEGLNAASARGVENVPDGISGERGRANLEGGTGKRRQDARGGGNAVAGKGAIQGVRDVEEIVGGDQGERRVAGSERRTGHRDPVNRLIREVRLFPY